MIYIMRIGKTEVQTYSNRGYKSFSVKTRKILRNMIRKESGNKSMVNIWNRLKTSQDK